MEVSCRAWVWIWNVSDKLRRETVIGNLKSGVDKIWKWKRLVMFTCRYKFTQKICFMAGSGKLYKLKHLLSNKLNSGTQYQCKWTIFNTVLKQVRRHSFNWWTTCMFICTDMQWRLNNITIYLMNVSEPEILHDS